MKRKDALTSVILVLGIIGFCWLASCNRPGERTPDSADGQMKGKINLSGAFALYPLAVKWAEEFEKLYPGVTVNVSAGGAGKGMTDALSHMVDLGMYSKALSPEERAKGAWWIAVAKDAVLPTINANNPVLADLKKKGLTRQKFYDIFISGTVKTWGQAVGSGQKAEIQVFTRSDACGAADMWAKYLKNRNQEDLLGLGVNGDPGVADAVRRDPGGIGFNNMGFVFEMQSRKIYAGLAVIPIDLNENGVIDPGEDFYGDMDQVMKAINEGKYPSPPARDLYFVAGGKPKDALVCNFLKWILTDGQKYVDESGYVAIKPEQITTELQKLN